VAGSSARGSGRQARLHREVRRELVVVDSTDNLRGVLGNLAFSLSLYSGQMCTTPQNIYVPATASRPTRATCPSRTSAQAREALSSSPAMTPGRRDPRRHRQRRRALRATTCPRWPPARRHGRARHPQVTHPSYPDAVVRLPDWSRSTCRRGGIQPGVLRPVTFLIATDSTAQSLERLRDTTQEHGAMTAAVYSTSEDVLDDARDAAADAGVALSRTSPGRSSSTRPRRSATTTAPAPTRRPTPRTSTRPSCQPLPRGHLTPSPLTCAPLSGPAPHSALDSAPS
jgi:hypothetical protein